MDLLNGRIKTVYFKYLAAAFGSTLIPSVYSVVDMAMVGKYHGPNGPAALAVFAPIWNILYGLGLLAGIGGSVLFSNMRGSGKENTKKSNEIFTSTIILGIVFSILIWGILICFHPELLRLFGADSITLPMAQSYLKPILFVAPLFLFNQLLAAFLRNDGNPILATSAVFAGGIFNVFGDYFFVFPLNMGIFGAGLATATGGMITFLIMLTHFISRKNTMQIIKPTCCLQNISNIIRIGFSTCIVDFAAGMLTVLFNRQIMKYFGTDALSIYGIIVNISTFVLCCAYSVGQAAQPIISMNYGAHHSKRVRECMKYAVYTAGCFGVFWTMLSVLFPNMYVYIFMAPTESVLQIAPMIIRAYGLSFLLLPLNIFSTYFFQSILQPKISLIVSLLRGVVISGILILVLPVLAGINALWYSMLISELFVALYVMHQIVRRTKEL